MDLRSHGAALSVLHPNNTPRATGGATPIAHGKCLAASLIDGAGAGHGKAMSLDFSHSRKGIDHVR
jgi:hypothetical protein